MAGGETMLKIGDFSTLSKISIHMLRHYDRLDLLVPAHVDHESGYRYYSENQLTDANRIQALKSMGLGLSTIKEIVNQYQDNESLAGYLGVQVTAKHEELKELKRQINQLETTIRALRNNESLLRYSIEVKQIPQRIVASTRGVIPAYNHEGELWKVLIDTLGIQHIPAAGLSYDMAIFHDEGFVENGIDVEVQKTVAGRGIDTDQVKFKDAPSMLAAVLTYEGEYGQIAEIGELIANWVQDNHYEFCGSHFNIYHISPATEKDRRKMVTEVGFPIQKLLFSNAV